MPIWNNKDKEKDRDRESQQESDRRALERGRLPYSAQERLRAQLEASKPAFSSTLGVREFATAQQAGVRPLSQVMGTAYLKLPADRKALRSYVLQQSGTWRYAQPVSGELYELSSIRLDARALAISRMAQEAAILKASGVIGVKVVNRIHKWGGARTLEITVTGTAVYLPGRDESRPLFTSLLSGQELWQLWQAGWEPTGIALGICSYTDCTASSTIYERSYNQEIASYTQCFYEAHHLAMRALKHDLRRHHAEGAVGVEIDYEFEDAESEVEVSEGNEVKFLHLITHFATMGTAIVRRQGEVTAPPATPLLVYDLAKKCNVRIDLDDRGVD